MPDCMESKGSNMGLPGGAVSGSGTPMNVMPNGTSEVSSTAAPTMPVPNASVATVNAPSITTDTPHVTAPSAAPISTPMPPHVNTPPPPYMPNLSTAIVPVSTTGFAASGLDSMKKKRGRPRKYEPGGTLALSVTPLLALSPSSLSPSQKRGRGRPLGSGKNQQLAALGELMLGSIGAGFTPHAITVAAGEDVASRIMSFSQQGPRGICILSANGAISSVTLRQPSISGGILTYEGRFEILSLSGSFLLTESGGMRSRTGGLSVSLAGPDGRVVGGSVAGVLMAASPVQVIVGSFMCNAKRLLPKHPKTEGVAKPVKPTAPTTEKIGVVSLIAGSESKPEGVKKADILDKGTMGGKTSSDSASPPESQAIPPPQHTSQSLSQIVSEEKQLANNNNNNISLPGGCP